jgi:ATP P2X receptor
MPTFRDLVDTIYSDIFAYTTVKVVRTKDWRLSSMKRMFNAGAAVYILFFLVFAHGYLYKEVPVVTVSTSVDGSALALQLANLSFVYSNGGYPPTYCAALRTNSSNTSASYSTTVTDYVYDLTRLYINNECARYFTPPEITEKVYMGVWLYTYWQQSNFLRPCSPNNYTGTALAGANGIPTPSALVGNPSNVPNCGAAQLLLNQSVIPVAAEFITLTLAGTYVTSWGATRTRMNTTIVGPLPANAAANATPPSINFSPTTTIQLTFAQLLTLAGIDLDSQNVIQDGGWGPGVNWPPGQTVPGYPSYVPTWPTFRISGVEIIMEMKYFNYVETLLPPDPFNLDDYLVATVRIASNGTFRGPGTKIWYLGPDITQPETQFMARTPQGVLLTFLPSGSIGTFSFGSLLSTLVGAFVLFGAATAVIDISAAFLIEGFREQKFEDELELRIRAMLRTQLADVPTRVEIDEYEQEALMSQLQAEAAMARRKARYDRMRVRAQKRIPQEARDAAAAAAGVAGKPVLPALPAGPVADANTSTADEEAYEPVARTPTAPLTGNATTLTPRVVRLIINGERYHGSTFTAQGFLENCRCVRFQWYRSRDGIHFIEVPGATTPTFYANADDLGYIVAVDATPVTDDGFEGDPKRAYTAAALSTRPFLLGRVQKFVGIARGGFKEIRDGVWLSGVRSTLTLRRDKVEARTKKSVNLGSIDIPGIDVALSRDDPRAMTLTGSDGMVFDVTFQAAEDREIVAMTIRELAGDNIELKNDPQYHPKPPADSDSEEEDE